jgi:DNA-binding NtrC family response regulator
MRALLVDRDWTLLQHCLARIRGRQQLALATSKAQALALLRHAPDFEVVIACENLEDGSGLALLNDIHVRWPHLIRVFSAESPRLALVRNQLNAFRLRYTLTYPIKPAKLELMLLRLARAQAAAAARPRTPRRSEV